VNIGEPRRMIQVEPVDVPVPAELPIDEPTGAPQEPDREPVPAEPVDR